MKTHSANVVGFDKKANRKERRIWYCSKINVMGSVLWDIYDDI